MTEILQSINIRRDSDMKTKFQADIKKEDLVTVTKMLHPELETNIIEQRIKYGFNYTWVTVQFHIKSYGDIDFAINNHEQKTHILSGAGVTKENISNAIRAGNIYFRCWRMILDKGYDKEATGKEVLEKQFESAIIEVQKYISERYSLPTTEEFYNNYYSD